MEQTKSYFRLGLFVTLTVAIVAAVLFILGGRALFQPTMTIETYFEESVAGLEIGSPVKFKGIPLGQVVEIKGSLATYQRDVPPGKRREYIVVRAKLSGNDEEVRSWQRDLDGLIKAGLRVRTQLAGITGQQYLALDILDPKAHPPLAFEWKPTYPYIPSAPSSTGEILENARKFIANLGKVDVEQLARNLDKVLVTANRKLEELPVKELSAEASGLLKDTRVAVARVNGILANPGIKQTVDNAGEISERLRKLADSGELDRMVTSIGDAATRIDDIVAENQYDVRVLVQDLRVTAANLRALSEAIKRYPAGALLGGPPDKVQIPGKSP